MVEGQFWLLFVEAFGLFAVSIIDIKSTFAVHAACYALWIAAFNFNMLFSTILHYHSGVLHLSDRVLID
jgi:hypothetical protein